jgi:hypothetical protein
MFLYIHACKNASPNELIIGRWEMQMENSPLKAIISFEKDSATFERFQNGNLAQTYYFSYQMLDDGKYLNLLPLDSGGKHWKPRILKLNRNILSIQSQSPDSSQLIFKKIGY